MTLLLLLTGATTTAATPPPMIVQPTLAIFEPYQTTVTIDA